MGIHSNRLPGKKNSKKSNSVGLRQNKKLPKNIDGVMKRCESNKNGRPPRQVLILNNNSINRHIIRTNKPTHNSNNGISNNNNSSSHPTIVHLLHHRHNRSNRENILVPPISMLKWRINQQMMAKLSLQKLSMVS